MKKQRERGGIVDSEEWMGEMVEAEKERETDLKTVREREKRGRESVRERDGKTKGIVEALRHGWPGLRLVK